MSLARNAGRMSLAVLFSRVLGLVREQVFAALFGAGMASDAYFVAFRIPNLLRDLFAEGALSLAFVTIFSRERSDENRKRIARDIMTALTVIVGLVCVGLYFIAGPLITFTAPQFAQEDGKLELTIGLAKLFSPFLFFVSSAALAMGILNTLGMFFTPSIGPAFFNVGNVVVGGGLAWLAKHYGYADRAIWGFGVGTLLGGFLQWAVQWPALLKKGYVPWAGLSAVLSPSRVKAAFRDEAFRNLIHLMAPAVITTGAVQISNYIGTSFAASLEQGSVSWITYSYRILHFPLGVFGVALSTAAHPKLASLIAENRVRDFEDTLEEALSLSWILGFGSALGMYLFREPLVAMFFEHGHFSARDTLMTGQALTAYAIGLLGFILSKIFVQAFYAVHKVWIATAVSLLSVALSAGLNFTFAPIFGHAGIPLSTSLTSIVSTLILGFWVWRQGFVFLRGRAAKAVLASLVGALGIGLVAWLGAVEWVRDVRHTHGGLMGAFATLTVIAAAGLVYIGVVAALTPQGRVLVEKFRRRLKRS